MSTARAASRTRRIRQSVIFCLALAMLQGEAASAEDTSYCFTHTLPSTNVTGRFREPMHYEIGKVGNLRVLLAEGVVEQGETMRLANALALNGPIDEVWLNSPGGNAYEGLEMGRVLRRQGLVTRLRANHACISACSYAFLGGAVRIVEPGGYYGVHMFSAAGDQKLVLDQVAKINHYVVRRAELIEQGEDPDKITQALADLVGDIFREWEQESALIAAKRARYLVEMSLSLDFMTDAFGTKSKEVCYLNAAGLAHYNVANAR